MTGDLHGIGGTKSGTVNDDGTTGEGEVLWLDGVGVQDPTGVGVVGATIPAGISDAEADDLV